MEMSKLVELSYEGLVHGYGIGSELGKVGMAEDELTHRRLNEGDAEYEEWLQLGIGSRQDPQTSPKKNGPGQVELELMPNTSIPTSALQPESRPPRPVTDFVGFSPSFLSPHSSFSPYFRRPSQLYAAVDFRVIQPLRRPHSGIWFTLQASQNQEKEPFMPQISKSYLRIKDGRMTIRVVIKYLVDKLGLDDESEIEMRCKGQRLQPLLTLQHVRDNIWSSPRDFITLLPNSSTTHHIMVLHYARI